MGLQLNTLKQIPRCYNPPESKHMRTIDDKPFSSPHLTYPILLHPTVDHDYAQAVALKKVELRLREICEI
jgi:hypothetical protein